MGLNNLKLRYFADYIEKELGIVYAEQNYFQLEQRLERIAQALGLTGVEAVYEKAVGGIVGDMKALLLDIATNNETSFFRDPKVFKVIEDVILPSLRTKFPAALSFRVWSAASSTGQEIYSVAMLVDEFSQKNPGHPRIDLQATDISDTVLKRAKEGRYTQLEVQRGLAASRLVKFFKKTEDNNWDFRADLRSGVRFSKFNLLDPPAGIGQFHLILCRYVLIYQDSERKKQILNRLVDCLCPGGVIFLGASESALGLTDRLKQVALDGAIYYEKK
jgi:chemotaxis protein methyltransferase CheR